MINGQQLMETLHALVNPLGLLSVTGSVLVFSDYEESYRYLLSRIYKNCPRGYIDLVWLFTDLWKIKYVAAERLYFDYAKPMGVKQYVLVNWKKYAEMTKDLQPIIKVLHAINETQYMDAPFLSATLKINDDIILHTM